MPLAGPGRTRRPGPVGGPVAPRRRPLQPRCAPARTPLARLTTPRCSDLMWAPWWGTFPGRSGCTGTHRLPRRCPMRLEDSSEPPAGEGGQAGRVPRSGGGDGERSLSMEPDPLDAVTLESVFRRGCCCSLARFAPTLPSRRAGTKQVAEVFAVHP